MKLQFIMCGNHTDAFLSQAAIFRRALDSFGGDHAAARLALCVGGPERQPLPERWRVDFERIELPHGYRFGWVQRVFRNAVHRLTGSVYPFSV